MIENKPAFAETEKGTILPDPTQSMWKTVKAWATRLLVSTMRMPFFGWVALFYLAAITLAEGLTTLVSPQAGLTLHGLILITLLLESAFSDHKSTRRFLLALAMAPLTRLLSLVLPLQPFPLVYWYVLVGLPLGLAAAVAARVEGFSPMQLGLSTHDLPFQALISLSGIGLGAIEYLILRPKPLITSLRLDLIWLPALILLIFTGLLEEFIFRGLIQSAALRKLGPGGIIYSALLFAVLHMGYKSWLDIAFVLAVAIFFGWAVRSSSSILGTTLAHGLTNIGLFLVFPFLLTLPTIPQTGPPITAPLVVMTTFPTAPAASTPASTAPASTAPAASAPAASAPVTSTPTPAGLDQTTPGLLQQPTLTPFLPRTSPVPPTITAPVLIPTANWITLPAAPP